MVHMTARALRLVQPTENASHAYVVVRTSYTAPGAPYVIAECIDADTWPDDGFADVAIHTAAEMAEEPSLQQALRAWQARDTSVARAEREAAEEAFDGERRAIDRSLDAPTPRLTRIS